MLSLKLSINIRYGYAMVGSKPWRNEATWHMGPVKHNGCIRSLLVVIVSDAFDPIFHMKILGPSHTFEAFVEACNSFSSCHACWTRSKVSSIKLCNVTRVVISCSCKLKSNKHPAVALVLTSELLRLLVVVLPIGFSIARWRRPLAESNHQGHQLVVGHTDLDPLLVW